MNKVLISGASSGIGLSISKKLLSKSSYEIVAISRDFSKVDISSDLFHKYEIDLSKIESLPQKLQSILKDHEDINTLILSAGQGIFGKIEELSFLDIKYLMDLNFLSSSYIVKTFLPSLKKKDNANIIFLGSTAAIQGQKEGTIYCSSKFAIRGFAQALREECSSSNVRVSIIQPGMVRTPFYDNLHFEPKTGPLHALQAEDISEIIELMLSLDPRVSLDEIIISPQKKSISFKSKVLMD